MSKVYDLTVGGGWPSNLSVQAVCGFIDLTDMWPGDILVVAPSGEPSRCTMHFVGTGEWVLKDSTGREAGRVVRFGGTSLSSH